MRAAPFESFPSAAQPNYHQICPGLTSGETVLYLKVGSQLAPSTPGGGNSMLGRRALLVIPLAFLISCGQGGAPSRNVQPSVVAPSSPGQDRTVTMAVRYEPPTLV